MFGGYNCEYMDDFYLLNMKSLTTFQDKISDLKKFINNEMFSDFQIKFKENWIFCHSQLFFQNIPCEDIAKSKILLKIYNKTEKVLDLSHLKTTYRNIQDLLEFLYLGIFLNHHFFSDYHEIYKISEALNLNIYKNKIVSYIKSQAQNIPPLLSNYDIVDILKNKPSLVYNDGIPVSTNSKKEKSDKIQITNRSVRNLVPFRCKVLSLMLNDNCKGKQTKNVKLFNIPTDIISHIYHYIMTDQLPMLYKDLSLYLDLLFFADYLCFDSLFNVKYFLSNF